MPVPGSPTHSQGVDSARDGTIQQDSSVLSSLAVPHERPHLHRKRGPEHFGQKTIGEGTEHLGRRPLRLLDVERVAAVRE